MSGGHFDYKQYHINDIADEVEQLIRTNDDKTTDEYGDTVGRNYPPEVMKEFKRALESLRFAAIYANRIDWLVSGDDGEETFLERLNEELDEFCKGWMRRPLMNRNDDPFSPYRRERKTAIEDFLERLKDELDALQIVT